MVFSDTTNKSGIIQTIERLCGLTDAYISSNTTLLKRTTASVNDAFDEVLPFVLSHSDFLRFDDLNHTDLPVGTFNLVSGQGDYSVAADDNGLDILNIVGVRILKSSSSTKYEALERITMDDDRAEKAISPDSGDSGIPTGFVEFNNTIFFDVKPNYSATNGGKIFFEREPSYFASTDTTKEPGIPKPFHSLLAHISALEFLLIYFPDKTHLKQSLTEKIREKKAQLSDLIEKRTPLVRRISVNVDRSSGSASGRLNTWGSDSNK